MSVAEWRAYRSSADPRTALALRMYLRRLGGSIRAGRRDMQPPGRAASSTNVEEARGSLSGIESDGARAEALLRGEDAAPFAVPADACRRCRERGKTWAGADPECAFRRAAQYREETWLFTIDNWNCATMNELRDLSEPDGGLYHDDSRAGIVRVPERDDGVAGGFLLLLWYKHRGRTDGAHHFETTGGLPRPLELSLAESILDARGR